MWHVHQRCQEATRLDDAIVATDDHRIEETCRKLGIRCVMTGEHATGTDRVVECAQHLDTDAYINVQGDEPFIVPVASFTSSSSVCPSVWVAMGGRRGRGCLREMTSESIFRAKRFAYSEAE
ncbi:hypothetical protein AB0C96_23880 [Streptomyces sp. NPDC048506]|uniref:cytidylyltransferase domain-containing protein n=1 Tax=Streptomyces sp. NPDC048506 TaxID=3155028 RepID=UPI00342C1EF8